MAKKEVGYSRKAVTTVHRELSKELKEQIWQAGILAAQVWNLAFEQSQYWLGLSKNHPERRPITPFSFNYWLNDVKDKDVFLSGGGVVKMGDLSTPLRRETCRALAGAWKSYFELLKKADSQAKSPRRKREDTFQTMAWPSPPIKNIQGKACFVLNVMKGVRLEIPLDRRLTEELEGKEIKEIKVSRIRRGTSQDFAYKLSVVYAYHPPKTQEVPITMRAVDFGAGDMAVCDSTGESYLVPMRRPDKHWMKEIEVVEKRIASCTKGSRAYYRRLRARQKMYNKSGDQKKDFQRKLALALIAEKVRDSDGKVTGFKRLCDVIVLSESVVRLGLARSENGTEKQHRGAQNTGYLARLPAFIKEKAIEFGVLVIERPDPPRTGDLRDKTQKLGAAAFLLRKAGEEYTIGIPSSFTLKKHFPISC